MRIRIQHFRSMGSGSGFRSRSSGFDDQKLKKCTAKRFFYFYENYNFVIPRPPERTSKLQQKPSPLKREHPALQNMKFINFFYFCGSFLPSWIRIRIQPNKINADPYPKHWNFWTDKGQWPNLLKQTYKY
jgi:hypothetical protein